MGKITIGRVLIRSGSYELGCSGAFLSVELLLPQGSLDIYVFASRMFYSHCSA